MINGFNRGFSEATPIERGFTVLAKVDTAGVAGSIPAAPTISSDFPCPRFLRGLFLVREHQIERAHHDQRHTDEIPRPWNFTKQDEAERRGIDDSGIIERHQRRCVALRESMRDHALTDDTQKADDQQKGKLRNARRNPQEESRPQCEQGVPYPVVKHDDPGRLRLSQAFYSEHDETAE